MFKKTLLMSSLLSILLAANISANPESGDEADNKRVHHKGHQGQRVNMDRGGMHGLHKAFAKLDLSEQQKESLEALKEANKESIKANQQAIHNLKEQMPLLLEADPIDENAVKNLSAQIADLKAEQMIKMVMLKKQAIGYLTEEQKVKLAGMKEKREKRRAERHSNS